MHVVYFRTDRSNEPCRISDTHATAAGTRSGPHQFRTDRVIKRLLPIDLTSIQKVWGHIKAAKLVIASERSRALDFLENALAEGRRIGNSDPDRARALTAVAAGFAELDPVRSWELLSEVIKAANGADTFTGEDSSISAKLQTRQMVVMNNASAEEFDLLSVFRQLARADLLRAIQLAKGFTGEAPRAVATLAIARSVLEKSRPQGAAN